MITTLRRQWQRLNAHFVDREFFMRAHGQVRFLKISAALQRRVATGVAAVLGIWLLITLVMIANQFTVSIERMALIRKEKSVATAAERVKAYKDDIDDVARDLEKRQDTLDGLWKSHFGGDAPKPSADSADVKGNADKIGALVPEAAPLARLEDRQIAFAVALTRIAEKRAKAAEQKVRAYGLTPVAGEDSRAATGGPFIPFFGGDDALDDPRFDRLMNALTRMRAAERAVAAIPSTMPAAMMSLTSQFGYRHDPFTGAGAMHSGLDFRGEHGSPILAAANGTVSFAGWRGGYGNCIEITHANGLLTRYAHLSGIMVHEGDVVRRGVQIGRMGSTGRSTGTHLHFEVRINGKAVDPAQFLETKAHVQSE